MKPSKLFWTGAMIAVWLLALWFIYIMLFPGLGIDALYHYDEPVPVVCLYEKDGSTVARLKITRHSLISAHVVSITKLHCDTTLPVAEKVLPVEDGVASWYVDFDFLWATVNGGNEPAECEYRGTVSYNFLKATINYSWVSEKFYVPRPSHSSPLAQEAG